MLKGRRIWFWIAGVVALFCLFVAGLTFSPSYRHCVTDEHAHQSNQAEQTTFTNIGILFRCEMVPLDRHAGALTAIGTFFIAIFTLTLWATSGAQIRLARQEFNATHRPRIIVRAFQFEDPNLSASPPLEFLFMAHNTGDAPATITQVRTGNIVQIDSRLPSAQVFTFTETLAVPLRAGQKDLLHGKISLTGNQPMEIYGESKALYCIGLIVYVDSSGTERETGFCRRYFPRENRWEIKESEYEYSY
jgi:hypothetical protein